MLIMLSQVWKENTFAHNRTVMT